jgi:hypothetical protein
VDPVDPDPVDSDPEHCCSVKLFVILAFRIRQFPPGFRIQDQGLQIGELNAVLWIRILSDPHHFTGFGSVAVLKKGIFQYTVLNKILK